MSKTKILFFILVFYSYLIYYSINFKKLILLLLFCLLSFSYNSQVSITTSNYSQNFGTSNIASWTNNSTFLGWYLGWENDPDPIVYNGTFNVTTTSNTIAAFNNGGFFTYQCNSDANIKLGIRPSNNNGDNGTASGNGKSHIGLRIINNTGQSTESITVMYTGYQLSLAQNGTGNTNSLTFSYRISSTPNTSLTSGTWTNVSTLNYDAPNNSSTQGSNQVSGYPCTVSQNLSQCIDIPALNNGSEIMLRWTDLNNTYNDHHLAIDNVQILFHFNNDCSITLPIELIDFKGYNTNGNNRLEWFVASEKDNDYYLIEKSLDGLKWEVVDKIDGYGTTNNQQDYYTYDNNAENIINYYRLSQTDFNGVNKKLKIIAIDNSNKLSVVIKITNIIGQEVDSDYFGIKLLHMSNGEIIKTF